MSTTCKYCKEPENKQTRPGLICESCICFVHLTCLRRSGTPGEFACDVFFEFTCEDCAPDKTESFVRYKFPWVNVIYLTLNHLCTQSYGISHHGYFHYKTHICSFIDRYWQALFGSSNKQKKNWVGTIAGVLSVYNKLLFKSGSVALGEAGWWRLLHSFSPAVAAHIVQEMARDKPKNRPRNQLALDRNHFLAKIAEMGYKDLITGEIETPPLQLEDVPCKKRRLLSQDSLVSSQEYSHTDEDGGRSELVEEGADTYEESMMIPPDMSLSDLLQGFNELNNFSFTPADRMMPVQSDTSSIASLQHSTFNYESDSRSGSEPDKQHLKHTNKQEPQLYSRESLFSDQLNSTDLPWEDPPPRPPPKQGLVEMTQYEEVQLLKQVENMALKVKEPGKKAYLCRLKAKLTVRRLKRHKHLPLFDFDRSVKILGGYVTEDPRIAINADRVLDRFQRTYLIDNLCGTIASTNHGTLLVSPSVPAPFRSPYSAALLKPYIRRDCASRPLWLRLTDELLMKTHRDVPGYRPPAHASVDYSYVRPHHVPALNSLCAQFFWPGIDLTEALQYPEFSCVAQYKRLVVGCAFLVPDVGHSEAYISFILTRPEWRRAGIATFMLYHLLQTCTGKDVTLHVSPTNPSIFMYQKFGFKVEELVQDFYEKYFDIDYKGCRHALFLRLAR